MALERSTPVQCCAQFARGVGRPVRYIRGPVHVKPPKPARRRSAGTFSFVSGAFSYISSHNNVLSETISLTPFPVIMLVRLQT
jgi:hypothetical protein